MQEPVAKPTILSRLRAGVSYAAARPKRLALVAGTALSIFGSIGHGYTYSGHPVGAAAALATLKETIRLNVAANAAARGAELNAGLADLKTRHELVGDIRGKGLMAALELVSDRAKKSGASKDAVARVYETAYDAGVMVRTSGTNVIISPPLFERERLKITMEPFLMVEGIAEARHGTIHVKAQRIERIDAHGLSEIESHDFH